MWHSRWFMHHQYVRVICKFRLLSFHPSHYRWCKHLTLSNALCLAVTHHQDRWIFTQITIICLHRFCFSDQLFQFRWLVWAEFGLEVETKAPSTQNDFLNKNKTCRLLPCTTLSLNGPPLCQSSYNTTQTSLFCYRRVPFEKGSRVFPIFQSSIDVFHQNIKVIRT